MRSELPDDTKTTRISLASPTEIPVLIEDIGWWVFEMSYVVEFVKFEDGKAEPVVVDRGLATHQTKDAAIAEANVIGGTVQAMHDAVGYRIARDDGYVETTRIFGIN